MTTRKVKIPSRPFRETWILSNWWLSACTTEQGSLPVRIAKRISQNPTPPEQSSHQILLGELELGCELWEIVTDRPKQMNSELSVEWACSRLRVSRTQGQNLWVLRKHLLSKFSWVYQNEGNAWVGAGAMQWSCAQKYLHTFPRYGGFYEDSEL